MTGTASQEEEDAMKHVTGGLCLLFLPLLLYLLFRIRPEGRGAAGNTAVPERGD